MALLPERPQEEPAVSDRLDQGRHLVLRVDVTVRAAVARADEKGSTRTKNSASRRRPSRLFALQTSTAALRLETR